MLCSSLLVILNKMILTSNQATPNLILLVQSWLIVIFKSRSGLKNWKLLTLTAILNSLNIYFSINAVKSLNIAMFIALRKFSLLFTMIAEKGFRGSRLSVIFMILGSLISAYEDMTYSHMGYLHVMINNLLTATVQVFQKKCIKSGTQISDIIFMTSVLLIVMLTPLEFKNIGVLTDPSTAISLIILSLFGYFINASSLLVIKENDPLTLSISGSIKNIILSYLTIFGIIDGTYIYTKYNFIGLQINGISSLVYVCTKY